MCMSEPVFHANDTCNKYQNCPSSMHIDHAAFLVLITSSSRSLILLKTLQHLVIGGSAQGEFESNATASQLPVDL